MRMRLVVWPGLASEEFGHPSATRRRIHGFQAGRQWARCAIAAQRERLRALEQRLNRPADLGPKFHLSRNGALDRFPGQTGIQDQGIGKFHGLAHTKRVA